MTDTAITRSGPRSALRTRRAGLLLVALALGAASCGADDDSAPVREPASESGGLAGEGAPPASIGLPSDDGAIIEAPDSTDAPAPAPDAPSDAGGQLGLDEVAPLLAIDATVGLAVDDLATAVPAVVELATQYGGRIYDSDVRLGSGRLDENGQPVPANPSEVGGTLTIKVPPAQVEEMIAALSDVGTVVSRSQETEDVTAQVVDLDARILTARASVDNVRILLADAESLDQIVFLETELTNRQTRLEQLVAQRDGLVDRAALATVTVDLRLRPPTPDAPVEPTEEKEEDRSIGGAFRTGWDGFLTVLGAIALFIGYTAPFLVIGLLVGAVVWRVRRRRGQRNRATVPPPPPAPVAGPRTSEPEHAGTASIP